MINSLALGGKLDDRFSGLPAQLRVEEKNMNDSVPQSTSIFRGYGLTFLVLLIALIGLSL
jgi:hypothetical protein